MVGCSEFKLKPIILIYMIKKSKTKINISININNTKIPDRVVKKMSIR